MEKTDALCLCSIRTNVINFSTIIFRPAFFFETLYIFKFFCFSHEITHFRKNKEELLKNLAATDAELTNHISSAVNSASVEAEFFELGIHSSWILLIKKKFDFSDAESIETIPIWQFIC